MEYIKKILKQYKDYRADSIRDFQNHSDKCPHKRGTICDHPEAIKRRWGTYSVDNKCTFDNCPL